MVTVKAGGTLVAVKAAKDFRAEIGTPIAAAVPTEICHLFAADGTRVDSAGA